MKVLHVTFDYLPSPRWGMGHHVGVLAAAQSRAGAEVVVATTGAGGLPEWTSPTAGRHGAEPMPGCSRTPPEADGHLLRPDTGHADSWTSFPLLRSWNLVAARTHLARLATASWVPDVVHAHGWMIGAAAREMASQLGAQLVTTMHIVERQYDTMGWHPAGVDAPEVLQAEADLVLQSSVVLVPSEVARTLLCQSYPEAAPRVVVVPHGVDIAPLSRREPTAAEVVLYAGRLSPEKGIEPFLRACEPLLKERPQLTVRVAGTGPLHGDLVARLASSRIQLLGMLEPRMLAGEYAAASVVCVPSLSETFGLVTAEAMAAGRPVVTTAGPLIAPLVEHGVTGLTVPVSAVSGTVGATVALTQAIGTLLEGRDVANGLAARARAFACAELSSSTMAARTMRAYPVGQQPVDESPRS